MRSMVEGRPAISTVLPVGTLPPPCGEGGARKRAGWG